MATKALQRTKITLEALVAEKWLFRKTVAIVFLKKKKKNEEKLELEQNNQIISYKESTKSLDMTVNSQLIWEAHIIWIIGKENRE